MSTYTALPNALLRVTAETKRLGADVAEVPNTFAVYALKYEPTARVYFGSTLYLRDKLIWWYHAIQSPREAHLPQKIRLLLAERGNDPGAWSYAIVDTVKPAGFQPKAKGIFRPEWAYVERAAELGNEHLLLNSRASETFKLTPITSAGRKGGMTPSTYLAIRLGEKRGVSYEEMPTHNWREDPTQLIPVSHPSVPFAMYLHRSLKAMSVRNPSKAAIAALYADWLSHVPGSEREAVGNQVPYTIDESLRVQTPRGYDLT